MTKDEYKKVLEDVLCVDVEILEITDNYINAIIDTSTLLLAEIEQVYQAGLELIQMDRYTVYSYKYVFCQERVDKLIIAFKKRDSDV